MENKPVYVCFVHNNFDDLCGEDDMQDLEHSSVTLHFRMIRQSLTQAYIFRLILEMTK